MQAFIVDLDTKISFRIRRGTKWCKKTTFLVVNLPQLDSDGTLTYSATQPFMEDGSVPELGQGWQLPIGKATKIVPEHSDNPNEIITYYEFDVTFSEAGAFFV